MDRTAKPLSDQIHDGHRAIACAAYGKIVKTRSAVQDRMTARLRAEFPKARGADERREPEQALGLGV